MKDATLQVSKPVEFRRSRFADLIQGLLDPIPFGVLVAVLVFDIAYANTAEVFWLKAAAWLIVLALLVAVVPRLVNLVRVWFPGTPRAWAELTAFWFDLLGLVAAIVNAFVHSRDAYAVVPDGVWLSGLTVVALAIARVILTVRSTNVRGLGK